jgi:hypothetical protein
MKIVGSVTVVGHKKNLEVIRSCDGQFEELYKITALKGIKLIITEYEDDNNLDFYRVPEKYWYDFLIWCFDHYPKISNLNGATRIIKRPKTRSLACWDQREDEFDHDQAVNNINGLNGCKYRNPKELALRFIVNHGCLGCVFFRICGRYCPGEGTDDTICLKRQYLNTLKQKIEIRDNNR